MERWVPLAALIRSSPHNLVSERDRERLEERHLPECLELAAWLPQGSGQRWLDLGTGGGLPGLVLAGERPDIDWTLVDARRKKAAAVREFAAELGVDCLVVQGRVEDLGRQPEWRGQFDGVVARAVTALPRLVGWAAPLLQPGGRLLAVKGSSWRGELAQAQATLQRGHMSVVEVGALGPAGGVVVVLDKHEVDRDARQR